MNKLLLTFLSLFLSISLIAQIDISDARGMSIGSTVTIEGVATNGFELGIIRYIQDATGAIAAYPGAGSVADFPDDVQRGDRVEITGELKEFNGLLEIDPITSYNVISSGNDLPDPLVVTPNGLNEDNEGKLLKINGVNFDDGGGVFSVGNYTFQSGGESGEIYVRSNHPLIGTDIPLANVNLTGIASQFNTIYQLLLRDGDDIEIADDFYFTEAPIQTNLGTDGFTVSWKTNEMGSTVLKYGTTTDMNSEMSVPGNTTNHSVTLTGLDPAEFYYVQAVSDNGSSMINSAVKYYSTASTSTGTMRIYFNSDVDGSFSNGNYPTATTPGELEAAILNKINAAESTIDVSVYNNNRTTIVAALTEAYNNGIQVRYIADDETANLALADPTPPFPVIKGNVGSPLMHNKFLVIDAESVDKSWVIMGSTNFTSQNLSEDYNNMMMIQDHALAKAYTIEFEEMWGSDGPDPGIFNLKFGESKEDNTPHLFLINGATVESYFSPSDNTSVAIANAIATADTDLQFALLTFTKNELGTAVRDAHDDNVDVRGIIDNINDQGSEYDWLVSQGVDVIPDNTSKQTHHKYAIIDATNVNSDPKVITGSHNWSNSADVRNDENTLIIQDANVANIFLQEFEARWCEATSGTNCVTNTQDLTGIDGFAVQVNPNPARENLNLQLSLEQSSDLVIKLWTMEGRILRSVILRQVQGERSEQIEVSGLPAGNYVLTFETATQGEVHSVIVVD